MSYLSEGIVGKYVLLYLFFLGSFFFEFLFLTLISSVHIYPPNLPTCRLRELTTAEIGKLVSVTGVVTRTSEVRPELLQGTFKCLECGGVVKNVEQQFKYTEVIYR